MSLAAGTRLGPYEILAAIGAGGMGEVYRARDTKLQRDVAIKVLPDLFAADPDRLARFEREAQTLAALNHPHIAQIFGLVDLPAGGQALVMEFVQGENLAERLRRGVIRIDEALAFARQIASAVDAAHEQGIVHRDLKPANVQIRADGTLKVLDFGLAVSPAMRPADPANSPTFTSPMPMTEAGIILGTAAYMAPEQARGKTVDRRADVWAFGCVLFEMLSGTRAFDGESIADVMGAIVSRDPDWARLPAGTPDGVRDVLALCLQRDPANRLKDLGDVAMLLTISVERDRDGRRAPAKARSTVLAFAGWAVAAAAAVLLTRDRMQAPQRPAPPTMRFELPLSPPAEARQQQITSSFTLSPDATRLVYIGRQGSSMALFLRDLESGAVRALPETTDAFAPFFSPDGSQVGFSVGNRLRALQLSAQFPRDLAAVPAGGPPLVGDWGSPAGIVFSDRQGLSRVAAEGGTAAVFASLLPTESAMLSPRALPDDRRALVAIRAKAATRTDDPSQVAIVGPSGEHRVLVEQGGTPALVRTGTQESSPAFLVFGRGGRLWAARLDVERGALIGTPQAVVDNVEMRANGDGAQYAVAENGTLAYLEASQTQLVWVDRGGASTPISPALRRFAMPRVSPDGRTVAVEVQDVPHQVWLLDPGRDLLTPITQTKDGSHNFAWSPDGRAIVFTASAGATTSIMWMPADGSRAPETVLAPNDAGAPWVEAWSRDGRWLAVTRRKASASDLHVVPLEPGEPPKIAGAPRPIANLSGIGIMASFSPDSQWVAWCDCVADQTESKVFITRLSDGRRHQVSVDGGSEPAWGPSGREIFFRQGPSMMVAEVSTGAAVTIGRPRKLIEGESLGWRSTGYDVARDGRFVMVRSPSESSSGRALSVRLNWVEELKKLKF
jgi:Tol biopolymer transport system component